MCYIYKLLFRLVPIKKWQAIIISRHFESCPACRAELLEERLLSQWVITPSQLNGDDSLWWGIRAGIAAPGSARRWALSRLPGFYSPRLAWGMAAAVVVIAAMLLTVPTALHNRVTQEHYKTKVFSVRSAEREGKPANYHVFSSTDPDMTMVWVEKN